MNIHSLRRASVVLCALVCVQPIRSQQHAFGVDDDIGITRFGNIWGEAVEGGVLESPDGEWLSVHTVRADLRDDRAHDQLRLYRSRDLLDATTPSSVKPTWVIEESVVPLVNIDAALSEVKWIGPNRLAFLKWNENGNKQLFLVDPSLHRMRALTAEAQDVISYAISDEKNFAYTVPAEAVKQSQQQELSQPARVAGERDAYRLLFPEKEWSQMSGSLVRARRSAT